MKLKIKTIIFLFIIAAASIILTLATLNRTQEGCIQLSDFYKLEENQVDVLCIGSSHVYYGINTCLLYDRYGIASYLLASPGQPVWLSYYLLEEALKTQSPRLVVLDTGTIFRKEDDYGSYSWETLISMKPSAVKWHAIQAVNRYGECLDAAGAFFSFPYYHTRFLTLTREDYRNTEQIRYNGYRPAFTVIPEKELAQWKDVIYPDSKSTKNDADTDSSISKTPALTERAEYYLRKFIELCRDREIALLLVNSPFVNQTAEKWEASRCIQAAAAEYDTAFIEGNTHAQEMNIDFSKDLTDASHLNYYGSIKYTNYLAEWMIKNCSLPDRRADQNYQNWKKTSDLFRRLEKENIA